jgi:hypothetical protein
MSRGLDFLITGSGVQIPAGSLIKSKSYTEGADRGNGSGQRTGQQSLSGCGVVEVSR